MLLITCPWCGPRNETEFRYGGQSGISSPESPELVDDRRWGRFVFYRDNPKGPFAERWVHSAGCRRWFTVVRDTFTHQILEEGR